MTLNCSIHEWNVKGHFILALRSEEMQLYRGLYLPPTTFFSILNPKTERNSLLSKDSSRRDWWSHKRIPRNRETTTHRTKHARKHRTNTLGRPAELQWVRPHIQPTQIRRRVVTGGITCIRRTNRAALLVHKVWWVHELLGKSRGFEENEGESRLEMPFDVTMEEPGTWIVGVEAQRHGSTGWDLDCVTPEWVC
jgi:hypothetical protein